jgi:hypothetical protein
MESSFLFGESFIRFDVAFLALQQTNQNLCSIGSDHGLFLQERGLFLITGYERPLSTRRRDRTQYRYRLDYSTRFDHLKNPHSRRRKNLQTDPNQGHPLDLDLRTPPYQSQLPPVLALVLTSRHCHLQQNFKPRNPRRGAP